MTNIRYAHMLWAYCMLWAYLICCGHIACCGQCPLGISHMFWAYCICCGHITTYEIYVVGISRRVPPPVSQNAACHGPTFPVDRTICSICSIHQFDTQERAEACKPPQTQAVAHQHLQNLLHKHTQQL